MSGDATFYALGLTACGKTYKDEDLVAAVSQELFTNPNPNLDPLCGKEVIVTNPSNKKTVKVTVVDKCMGCKRGDIDLSPAAFNKLNDPSIGRFPCEWTFV